MEDQSFATGHSKRKISGYLIQPLMQSKIGIYCILLSIGLAVSIGWIIYSQFAELVQSVLVLTDAPEEVGRIFADYWASTQVWIYLVMAAYLLLTIIISLWYTHRFLGPTVAFRKHLEELAAGNFEYRTILRKGDAMVELAKALNRVSAMLKIEHEESDHGHQAE